MAHQRLWVGSGVFELSLGLAVGFSIMALTICYSLLYSESEKHPYRFPIPTLIPPPTVIYSFFRVYGMSECVWLFYFNFYVFLSCRRLPGTEWLCYVKYLTFTVVDVLIALTTDNGSQYDRLTVFV